MNKEAYAKHIKKKLEELYTEHCLFATGESVEGLKALLVEYGKQHTGQPDSQVCLKTWKTSLTKLLVRQP